MLSSLDHHELLVFWVQLLVIYAVARLMGALAKRIGLPSVVGELTAGVLLGPSLFGLVWPDGFHWFLPESEVQSGLLLGVSWLSAAFLLVAAGFETDLRLIRKLGRAAALVTLGSVVLPFAGGLLVGSQMPKSLYGDTASALVFTLFIATCVSVSALAVVAKILGDLGLMRRDVGQITVAVGMANDLIGWAILGVISGLAISGEVSAADAGTTVAGLALFLLFALTIGQRLVDGALRAVRKEGANLKGALTVALAAMFILGVITQLLEVEAVLGAFVAGVILARSRYQQAEAAHVIEDLTTVLFAPIFFATAGLRLDLGLLRGEALVWAVALLAVALVLKFVGSYGGARLAGLTNREGMVLGAGLNARGALEIVIATVGLSLGVFNETSFTIIVMIPLITSLAASIGVRMLGRNLEGSVAERERLAQEEAMATNLVIRSGRLLLPTDGGVNSIVAAQIVQFAWPDDIPATLLSISGEGEEPDLSPLENVLFGRDVETTTVATNEAAEELVAESKLGYGAAAVGVSDEVEAGAFVSHLVDHLLTEIQIPLVLVRRAKNTGDRLPGIFARALVPVVGSRASRAALELAGNLSANLGTQLVITHVVQRSRSLSGSFMNRFRDGALGDETEVAGRVLAQAATYAAEKRASYRTTTRFATSASEEMIKQASQDECDLIVVGAELRDLDGRPSLGHSVEAVLATAAQTVVVVVLPNTE